MRPLKIHMLIKDRIVLASKSPRRKMLLEGVGLNIEVISSNVKEVIEEGENPFEFTKRVAVEKVLDVLDRIKPLDSVWIIGADTVVVCQGRLLNKPVDSNEAKEMLALLSGKTHKVVTSFCILNSKSRKEYIETVESFVTFRVMSQNEIYWYVNTEEPLDKAGAYGAQGFGTIFIEKIEGSYTNVVGLPLSQLMSALIKLGAVSF